MPSPRGRDEDGRHGAVRSIHVVSRRSRIQIAGRSLLLQRRVVRLGIFRLFLHTFRWRRGALRFALLAFGPLRLWCFALPLSMVSLPLWCHGIATMNIFFLLGGAGLVCCVWCRRVLALIIPWVQGRLPSNRAVASSVTWVAQAVVLGALWSDTGGALGFSLVAHAHGGASANESAIVKGTPRPVDGDVGSGRGGALDCGARRHRDQSPSHSPSSFLASSARQVSRERLKTSYVGRTKLGDAVAFSSAAFQTNRGSSSGPVPVVTYPSSDDSEDATSMLKKWCRSRI